MVSAFFFLTFALSWVCFWAAIGLTGALQSVVLFVGTVAPALVGLALIAWKDGRAGLASLGHRFVWPSSPRWYLFAIGYFLVIKLTAAVGYRLLEGAWPRFGAEAWYIIAIAIVISTPAQAGEEIGWRGYALPRLGARFGLRVSSIVLGVIWSLWHLPLFLLPGADKFGQSFPVYLLGTITLSVAMTWLYAHTNGSLWMTMLMHSAVNQTTGIVSSAVPGASDVFAISHSLIAWLTVALMGVSAAYFLIRMPDTGADGGEAAGPRAATALANPGHHQQHPGNKDERDRNQGPVPPRLRSYSEDVRSDDADHHNSHE